MRTWGKGEIGKKLKKIVSSVDGWDGISKWPGGKFCVSFAFIYLYNADTLLISSFYYISIILPKDNDII